MAKLKTKLSASMLALIAAGASAPGSDGAISGGERRHKPHCLP